MSPLLCDLTVENETNLKECSNLVPGSLLITGQSGLPITNILSEHTPESFKDTELMDIPTWDPCEMNSNSADNFTFSQLSTNVLAQCDAWMGWDSTQIVLVHDEEWLGENANKDVLTGAVKNSVCARAVKGGDWKATKSTKQSDTNLTNQTGNKDGYIIPMPSLDIDSVRHFQYHPRSNRKKKEARLSRGSKSTKISQKDVTSRSTPSSGPRYWTKEECKLFEKAKIMYGSDYARIAELVGTRDATQVRTHAQKVLQGLLRRNAPIIRSARIKDYEYQS